MFTGIVEERGRVRTLTRRGELAQLSVACSAVLAGAAVGDSIAVSGCCLTVTALHGPDGRHSAFDATMTSETLARTALANLSVGDEVNLERALAASDRLGGHLVQGHVDGVGTVVARRDHPGGTVATIAAPTAVARYVVAKGSIAVDGVSLTVVGTTVGDDGGGRFDVALIPHTLAATTLGQVRPGARVNLEADVIAKYVERLLSGGITTPYAATTDPEG